jgi:S1-C subfamily serine protease
MKQLTAALLFFALLTAAAATAQEVEHRTFDPETSMIFLEIGAIAGVGEDGDVVIETVLPQRARPQENRGVDVRAGDRLMMVNGQRARSIAGVREIYDGLDDGGEVKLALGRGEERLLVGFAKQDSDSFAGGGPGSRVRIVRAGPGSGAELLHEARAVLRESDGTVKIDAVLGDGGELRQGDVIGAVNGREVTDLAGYREAYAAVEIGGALRLTVRRGDEAVDVELTKEQPPEGMVIRRGSQ